MPSKPYLARPRLSSERAEAVGSRVRQARTAQDLTQEALAHRAGIATPHLQRLERGVGNPTLATLYALSDALQTPISDLLPADT